jgi:hypothetical protein
MKVATWLYGLLAILVMAVVLVVWLPYAILVLMPYQMGLLVRKHARSRDISKAVADKVKEHLAPSKN